MPCLQVLEECPKLDPESAATVFVYSTRRKIGNCDGNTQPRMSALLTHHADAMQQQRLRLLCTPRVTEHIRIGSATLLNLSDAMRHNTVPILLCECHLL